MSKHKISNTNTQEASPFTTIITLSGGFATCRVVLCSIVTDFFSTEKIIKFFLFLRKNMCYEYSLEVLGEALLMSTHNMFLSRKKKNIMWLPTFKRGNIIGTTDKREYNRNYR